MGTVQNLLEQKTPEQAELATLPPDATALDAARLMNDRGIGSVLIVQDDKLIGIFTERDVLRRIVAEKRDPAATPLSKVMTSKVAVAAAHTTSNEVRNVMRDKRIRHMPVLDGERLVGMISIGDLNRAEHDQQEQTIRYLEQYMSVM